MDLKKPLPEEECMKNLSKAYPSLPKDNEQKTITQKKKYETFTRIESGGSKNGFTNFSQQYKIRRKIKRTQEELIKQIKMKRDQKIKLFVISNDNYTLDNVPPYQRGEKISPVTFDEVPKNIDQMFVTSVISNMLENNDFIFTNNEDKNIRIEFYAVNNDIQMLA